MCEKVQFMEDVLLTNLTHIFYSTLGGFLASEFTLGELIWLDYLAGDFTLIGLIRR